MKKCLMFSLLLCLVLLSGCTSPAPEQAAVPVSETQPVTEPLSAEEIAAAMETWAFEWPTGAARERTLEGFELVLPEGMTREDISPQRASLMVDGQVVGGLLVMELDNSVVFHPGAAGHYMQIRDYLGSEMIPEVPVEQWSYVTGGPSWFAHAHQEMMMGTLDGREFMHYIFRYISFYWNKSDEADIYYDLWFDPRYVNEETMEAIVASVTVPSIEEETE